MKAGSELANLQTASDCISTTAEFKGYDQTYSSPFTAEARMQGLKESGGKPDDITVIVSQVRSIV